MDDREEQVYEIKDSAYVQNLAELSHTVMHDLRWRVPKHPTSSDSVQAESFRLFGLSYGDNMDAVRAFEHLYNHNLTNGSHPTDQPTTQNILSGRCMHLYARMFHRKGPWFTIDDLFFRYYYGTINSHSIDADNISQDKPAHDKSNGTNDCSSNVDSRLVDSIQCFFMDIQQLLNMGLIRTFQSEKECAFVIDDASRNGYGILNQNDLSKVCQRLGMGSIIPRNKAGGTKLHSHSKTPEQSILKYLSGQRTLSFSHSSSSSNSTNSSCMPVMQHVNTVILSNLCEKISLKKTQEVGIEKKEQVKIKGKVRYDLIDVQWLSKIWNRLLNGQHGEGATSYSSISRNSLLTCIRLKEEPLLTLRRVSRLLLCAGSGPGAMRWDGTNAWISLDDSQPEMKSSSCFEPDVQLYNAGKNPSSLAKTPSSLHWHNVEFPGLKHRLGLQDSHFYANYRPHLSTDFETFKNSSRPLTGNIFDTDSALRRRLAYTQVFNSYQMFRAWEECVDLRCWVDFLLENKEGPTVIGALPEKLCLHIKQTREKWISRFQLILDPLSTANRFWDSVKAQSEAAIASLSLLSKSGDIITDASADQDKKLSVSSDDIICYMAIICTYILLIQFETIEMDEMMALIARPWLRHMNWHSVLAYILWNCVEIFEKRGHYHIAVRILETILCGHRTVESNDTINDLSLIKSRITLSATKQGYVQFLLSRRVRGKAFDRLQVDCGHLERRAKKQGDVIKTNHSIDFHRLGSCGSIPFSYLRKLSKRMKVSISTALGNVWNIEAMELGIRIEQESPISSISTSVNKSDVTSSSKKKISNYNGWTPITDYSVANSLTNNSEGKGRKRCTYIGRESKGTYDSHSLNVEELAMEEYFLGLLPVNNASSSCPVGGWKGFHCEGGFLRLLFRLLCTEPVLAYDVENGHIDILSTSACENQTIYLSPYQSAPLDLHVAHSFYYTDSSPHNALPTRSFYERRKASIEIFLNYLENLSPQEISDLVYESVERNSGRSHPSSPLADSVRQVVRTCSAIAAGLGGCALASIFRSFIFDFRHYSAGLPDLLLIRANYESDCNPFNLGDWLGEGFSDDEKNLAFILDAINTKDYLGCSEKELKLNNNGTRLRSLGTSTEPKEKLQFVHNGRNVQVACMVVEVKSNNDSLDERQEDWLNIIDRTIPFRARVCKFTDSE